MGLCRASAGSQIAVAGGRRQRSTTSAPHPERWVAVDVVAVSAQPHKPSRPAFRQPCSPTSRPIASRLGPVVLSLYPVNASSTPACRGALRPAASSAGSSPPAARATASRPMGPCRRTSRATCKTSRPTPALAADLGHGQLGLSLLENPMIYSSVNLLFPIPAILLIGGPLHVSLVRLKGGQVSTSSRVNRDA